MNTIKFMKIKKQIMNNHMEQLIIFKRLNREFILQEDCYYYFIYIFTLLLNSFHFPIELNQIFHFLCLFNILIILLLIILIVLIIVIH